MVIIHLPFLLLLPWWRCGLVYSGSIGEQISANVVMMDRTACVAGCHQSNHTNFLNVIWLVIEVMLGKMGSCWFLWGPLGKQDILKEYPILQQLSLEFELFAKNVKVDISWKQIQKCCKGKSSSSYCRNHQCIFCTFSTTMWTQSHLS